MGGAGPAGLHLDEDEGGAVDGDDVELAVAGARVALEDLPARRGEAAGDQLLGPRPILWRATVIGLTLGGGNARVARES